MSDEKLSDRLSPLMHWGDLKTEVEQLEARLAKTEARNEELNREVLHLLNARDQLIEERLEYIEERARLRGALEVLEQHLLEIDSHCLECFTYKDNGHAENCRVGAALKAKGTNVR